MTERTVEDRLREEYFGLLPEMRRVAWQLEAEVRHCIMPMWVKLDQYERLDTTSRIKDCESAVDKLRRHQETRAFDRGHPDQYTLLDLKDLVGIRIHVFPGSRIEEVRLALCERYPSWTAEPFSGIDGTEERRAETYSS